MCPKEVSHYSLCHQELPNVLSVQEAKSSGGEKQYAILEPYQDQSWVLFLYHVIFDKQLRKPQEASILLRLYRKGGEINEVRMLRVREIHTSRTLEYSGSSSSSACQGHVCVFKQLWAFPTFSSR